MRALLLLPILLLTTQAFGQSKNYASPLLKQEMDSIIQFIEEIHPAPYTSIAKEKLFAAVERSKQAMPDSLNLMEYYAVISPIVSQIKDGHTGINFPYQELEALNPHCFPVSMEVTNNDALIVKLAYGQLPAQSRVISINGIPAENIVETLLNAISGEENSFKRILLNRRFTELHGAFYGFEKHYEIVCQNGTAKDTFMIAGLRWFDLIKQISNEQKKVTKKPARYTFETLADNKIGYIDFRSFNDLEQFKHFLDTSFSNIQTHKIEDLIIDLRNNGGGNSALGDELFQYIAQTPFAQYGQTTIKHSKKRKAFYDAIRENSFLNDKTDQEYDALFQHANGKVVVEDDSELIDLRDNPLRFSGQVYLLTSLQTFSSASNFAWCFKHFNMGTIIGQKTGGLIVHFGDLIYVTLPVSNLTLYASHKEFYGYGATDKERHGVYPDHDVKPDKAMDYTLELIERK